MEKVIFMNRLKDLLVDLPESERIEALQYYEDYFSDAGLENEQEVINELGSPEALAAAIHKEVNGQSAVHDTQGEYTEQGFHNANYYENLEYPERQQKNWNTTDNPNNNWGNPQSEDYGWAARNVHRPPKKKTGLQITFIVLACIFLLPFVVSAAIGVGLGLVGVLIGFLGGGGIAVVTGMIGVGYGIARLFSSVSYGVMTIGAGLVSLGLGLLLIEGGIWSAKGIKVLLRGTYSLVHRILLKDNSYEQTYEPE